MPFAPILRPPVRSGNTHGGEDFSLNSFAVMSCPKVAKVAADDEDGARTREGHLRHTMLGRDARGKGRATTRV